MAIGEKHFGDEMGSKRMIACAAPIASYIAIVLPVSFFLHDYRGLVHFFGLSMVTNAFIPNMPHETFIFIYANIYHPWLVAICGGIAVRV